jgi:hypothetical protein
MDSSVNALHNALCMMYHPNLGNKMPYFRNSSSFCLETWYVIVRDNWESDGINHLSTTRAPWWETEELSPLGGCILKECYNFQTK